MNCDECKQAMETYLDGELSEHEVSAVERHLASCQTCRMDVMSMDKCINAMRTVMEDVPPSDTIRAGIFETLFLPSHDLSFLLCSIRRNSAGKIRSILRPF